MGELFISKVHSSLQHCNHSQSYSWKLANTRVGLAQPINAKKMIFHDFRRKWFISCFITVATSLQRWWKPSLRTLQSKNSQTKQGSFWGEWVETALIDSPQRNGKWKSFDCVQRARHCRLIRCCCCCWFFGLLYSFFYVFSVQTYRSVNVSMRLPFSKI